MSAGALETQIAKDNLQALLIYAIAATVFTVCFANDYIIFLFLSSCSSLFFYLGESILHTFWNSLFLPLFLLKWFSFIMVFFFFTFRNCSLIPDYESGETFQELLSLIWFWVRRDFLTVQLLSSTVKCPQGLPRIGTILDCQSKEIFLRFSVQRYLVVSVYLKVLNLLLKEVVLQSLWTENTNTDYWTNLSSLGLACSFQSHWIYYQKLSMLD